MSNVTLSIGGRDFRVGCRDGQEDQIRKLGEMIDDKVREANVDNRSPAEMLLFASLLLADEVKDGKGQTSAETPGSAPSPSIQNDAALDDIAERLESLASRLEQAAASS